MRLTKKRLDGHYDDVDECVSTRCSDKLGELEDIEEELGIDLVIFAKACFDGFYCKEEGFGISAKHTEAFNKKKMCFESEYRDMGATFKFKYYLKDYGKTWALSKDELNK